ncbi:hypothetical protein Tco_0859880 [Tanacetum coccineum]|uniref:Retrovirus-related Pol polyprotein from transposon TNT 1-94 n=1 Tax=Tanacetum coccineum TaxID=301880 RepID=A0ABQ5BGA9_9ASTR
MMMGTKFDIEKFDEMNDFRLWQVRMKALLEQQGLAAALEELSATIIVAYDNVIQKKAYSALILCLVDRLVGDLAAIDIAISDEDQALLLLTSLPSSYDNFVKTLLYGRDTLKLEDVKIVRGQSHKEEAIDSGVIDVEGHLKRDCPRYNYKKSQGFVRNEDHVSSSRADSVDVMMVINVEQLLDWIMDSGGLYHMTYKRDYLFDSEEYDGGNTLLGDDKECRLRVITSNI